MLSVWYSFYWEESFEGTHLVCTWNFSVPLHQMRIQGQRIFRQAYSLDTWRQGALMYVVSWHASFKSSHGKADWIFTWHGEESFEGTHLVCTWNISVPLQQMRIQGKQSRIFRQAYYLDTWRQGAPMYVVSWHAFFQSSHGKADYFLHGMLWYSMCIFVESPILIKRKLTNT